MESNQLKLYVWEGVLTDYTSGMVVVLAIDDAEAAAKLQEEYFGHLCDGLLIEGVQPQIIDTSGAESTLPRIWHVHGGG